MDTHPLLNNRGGGQLGAAASQPPPRRPETPEERHARRVAFGRKWGAVMREHAQAIRRREAMTRSA